MLRFGDGRRPGVAGGDDELGGLRVTGECTGQGVLTRAGAEEQNLHGLSLDDEGHNHARNCVDCASGGAYMTGRILQPLHGARRQVLPMGRPTLMNPRYGALCWGEPVGKATDGGQT